MLRTVQVGHALLPTDLHHIGAGVERRVCGVRPDHHLPAPAPAPALEQLADERQQSLPRGGEEAVSHLVLHRRAPHALRLLHHMRWQRGVHQVPLELESPD